MTERERIISLAGDELSGRARAYAAEAREAERSRLLMLPELSEARTRLGYVYSCLDNIEIGKKVSARVADTAGERYADVFAMRKEALLAEKERLEALTEKLEAENKAPEARNYYCPLCRDRGYLEDGAGNAKRCRCFNEILSGFILEASGIPEGRFEPEPPEKGIYSPVADKARYGSDESPEKTAVAAYKAAMDFVSDRSPSSKKKMFITGRVGVGKTHLACCMATAAARQCLFVRYGSISVILDAIQNRIFNSDEERETYENRREYIENCDLLIIDDLGVENVTERRFENLITLLDKRTDSGRKTVITSNLGLREIKEVYGERLASRFIDLNNSVNIRLLGDDIRLMRIGADRS